MCELLVILSGRKRRNKNSNHVLDIRVLDLLGYNCHKKVLCFNFFASDFPLFLIQNTSAKNTNLTHIKFQTVTFCRKTLIIFMSFSFKIFSSDFHTLLQFLQKNPRAIFPGKNSHNNYRPFPFKKLVIRPFLFPSLKYLCFYSKKYSKASSFI